MVWHWFLEAQPRICFFSPLNDSVSCIHTHQQISFHLNQLDWILLSATTNLDQLSPLSKLVSHSNTQWLGETASHLECALLHWFSPKRTIGKGKWDLTNLWAGDHRTPPMSWPHYCYGLNVCVPHTPNPKFICWSPKLQHAVFGDVASNEVMKVKWGPKGGLSSGRISVLIRRDIRVFFLFLPPSLPEVM